MCINDEHNDELVSKEMQQCLERIYPIPTEHEKIYPMPTEHEKISNTN